MNSVLTTDEKYMRRCIQLARNGEKNAQPLLEKVIMFGVVRGMLR